MKNMQNNNYQDDFVDEADLFSDENDGGGQEQGQEQTVADEYREENSTEKPITTTPETQEAPPAPSVSGEEEAGIETELSGVEMFLSEYGINGGLIQFEDGTSARFSDLPAEEQNEILSSLISEAVPTVEERYDLDDNEIELLNAIRESGAETVEEFINNVVDHRATAILNERTALEVNFDEMPDEHVFLLHLKDSNPEMTEEELASELETAKSLSTFTSTAKTIRESFKNKQSTLEQEIRAEEQRTFYSELENQRQTVVESIEDIGDIAGAPINDEMKEYLLHDIMELNDNKDPILMEKVFSSPETMFEVNWFLNYGKDYINQLENYYKREISKAAKIGYQKGVNGMPGTPTILAGGRSTANNTSSQSPISGTFGEEVTEEDLFE